MYLGICLCRLFLSSERLFTYITLSGMIFFLPGVSLTRCKSFQESMEKCAMTIQWSMLVSSLHAVDDDWGTWRTSSILTRVYPKVCWEHIFEDCIQLYTEKSDVILNEFPFRIRYKGEMAVDTGGVSWDMFSAFGKMPTWQHLMEAIFLYLLHILAQVCPNCLY